ncbi:hypothetical protein HZ326_27797, partial [Fusarium oxysporum f. sp. albedinis]
MANPPLQRILNFHISPISPGHKLIELRGDKSLTTLTGLLEGIQRHVIVINYLLLWLCSYRARFGSCFLVLCVHLPYHSLRLTDPLLVVTPFQLEVCKFVRRVQGNRTAVCRRGICKAKVLFK